MSSCSIKYCKIIEAQQGNGIQRTLKDWQYQFLTFLIEGMSLRLCGSSSSSLALWANRIGSSSGDMEDKIGDREGGG